jgi:hypothetical protein
MNQSRTREERVGNSSLKDAEPQPFEEDLDAIAFGVHSRARRCELRHEAARAFGMRRRKIEELIEATAPLAGLGPILWTSAFEHGAIALRDARDQRLRGFERKHRAPRTRLFVAPTDGHGLRGRIYLDRSPDHAGGVDRNRRGQQDRQKEDEPLLHGLYCWDAK